MRIVTSPRTVNLSLRVSLGSAFVLAIVVTAFVLGAVTFLSVRGQLRQGLSQRIMNIASVAVLSIETSDHSRLRVPGDMASATYKALRARLQKIQAIDSDVKYVYTLRPIDASTLAFIVDTGTTSEDFSPLGELYTEMSPQLKASFDPPYHPRVDDTFYKDKYGVWLSGYAPLLNADGTLDAVMGMDISASKVTSYENYYLAIILAACLGVSLAGALVGILLSRRISKPLIQLATDMRKIQRFDLDGTPAIESRINEVVEMEQALEDMKKGLRSFKRYVPADVVSSLITLQKEATLETSRANLTFFFSDMENFTDASEKLAPEILTQFLEEYFDAMTSALQASRATVDKFIGDSIMAFWNAPRPLPDHALAACRAALACQKALGTLWKRWNDGRVPPMRTRMGIHTGEALVGNIGNKDRLSYTAIGDTVNLASRLEGLNKYYDTRLLVSETTLKALGGELCLRLVDRVVVKGRKAGIGVYELVSEGRPAPEGAEFLELWEGAQRLYEGREWPEAAVAFEDLVERRPNDGPSKILAARCRGFSDAPPSPDWNGYFVMSEK